jgi:hypothetical protein
MALHKPKQLYVLGKLRFCSIKPMKMIEILLKITFIFIKVLQGGTISMPTGRHVDNLYYPRLDKHVGF